jgi:hypothetical protein
MLPAGSRYKARESIIFGYARTKKTWAAKEKPAAGCLKKYRCQQQADVIRPSVSKSDTIMPRQSGKQGELYNGD